MKKTIIVFLVTVVTLYTVSAGVPLNNLQGVGGIAFNPLAYPAGQPLLDKEELPDRISISDYVRKPQLGAWYVNLGDVDVDWTTLGTAFTVGERLELSYGYEVVAQAGVDNIYKHNLGTKLLLIKENESDQAWVPAVAVGALWKTTDAEIGFDNSGWDFYLVATKLITQLPLPVLISTGILYTDEVVTGVFGHSEGRDLTWFANLDVIPVKNVAVGLEYKQGARFNDFQNADYWDAHVAWFVNNNLTLVGAYVNAGDEESHSRVGLGDGVVLSLQYAF